MAERRTAAGVPTVPVFWSGDDDDDLAEALALKDKLASGEYHAFTGPLKKQDGSDWLAEGETADDGTLAGMNFYVEGLTGEIPQ